MTSNASTDIESQLAALLDELSSVQQEMLEVLETKRDLMADGNIERMSELQPREADLCDRLEACHRRRASLLEAAGDQGLPSDSLGNLATKLPGGKDGGLTKQVKHASLRMRLLQHQSLTNWVLAQRTVLHLSQLLEIIATGGQLQPTYGRDDSSRSSGALVNREA